MQNNFEVYERIHEYADEMVKVIIMNKHNTDEELMRNALENMARTIRDLTNIELGRELNTESTLKCTLSKMKIAQNCLTKVKKDKVI
ncbi:MULTISPECIES: hypothetical protein [Sutcliffiella]|uniref:Uncharacterized protein n=1 Tax=Sutcliffiella cohnii TaxID=33932 RepID=A0A223KPM8_9BACI|nr:MULTISPECIES: hypothetical protein [Sutcliffiella]AST91475.1 hypothetical protein BC6307_09375 [Sutcliffiella cohnii]MED4014960.1 hypothetical protein [Sutcliffiella cohnii]WBL17307.1 hypothetical protein O1A01_12015 [Sutcliffiella sp. NC1]